MTSPLDNNQQLLAYMQVWRQLLEQWANMTAGLPGLDPSCAPPGVPAMPFLPPGMPVMPPGMPFVTPGVTNPPMPPAANSPMPPSPTDYTQQLFAYLQAWRQYLEQSSGTPTPPLPQSPSQPTASPPQPTTSPPSAATSTTQPTQPTEAGQQSGAALKQSNSGMKIPPDAVALTAAVHQLGNQLPHELDDEFQLSPPLMRPFNEVGSRSLFERVSKSLVTPRATTSASNAPRRQGAGEANPVTATSSPQLMRPLNEGASVHLETDGLLGRGLDGGMTPATGSARPRASQPPPARTPRTAFSSLVSRVNPAQALGKATGQGPAR